MNSQETVMAMEGPQLSNYHPTLPERSVVSVLYMNKRKTISDTEASTLCCASLSGSLAPLMLLLIERMMQSLSPSDKQPPGYTPSELAVLTPQLGAQKGSA